MQAWLDAIHISLSMSLSPASLCCFTPSASHLLLLLLLLRLGLSAILAVLQTHARLPKA